MVQLTLAQAAGAYGTPEFEDELVTELEAQRYTLPVDQFCAYGGAPDPDSYQFNVADVEDLDDHVLAHVRVDFTEVVPTACSDIDTYDDMHGELEITIEKKTGSARVPDRDLLE